MRDCSSCGRLHLIAVNAVEPRALGRCAIGVFVVERRRIALRVPFLAGGGAGLAADAGVEIDDEAELLLTGLRLREARSCAPPVPRCPKPIQYRELRRADLASRLSAFSMLHPQIIPGRLAGDRIGIGIAIAAIALGEKLGDQVVEQKAFLRFRRIGREAPRRPSACRWHSRSTPCAGLTPSMSLTCTLMRPVAEMTCTQSPSIKAEFLAARRAPDRASCGRGSGGARHSASPRSDTSPSAAG